MHAQPRQLHLSRSGSAHQARDRR